MGRGDDAGRPAIYFHKLGTAQDRDRLVYEVKNHPTHVPTARVTEDGHYLVVTLVEGYEKNARRAARPAPPGAEARAALRRLGRAVHASSARAASSSTSRRTHNAPLGARDWPWMRAQPGTARTVVPEGTAAIEQASYVGGRIIAQLRRGRARRGARLRADGKPVGAVPLPGLGGIEGFEGEGTQNETFFSYTDYLTPRRIFRLDVPTNSASLWREPRSPADATPFVTEQVFYTSKDGTRVPDVHHPPARHGEGRQPAVPAVRLRRLQHLAHAGSTAPQVLAWLEMGGAYAEANLRGGGEYGEAWHRAGTLANKQHVFDDFIAAAEYLIGEHYTRSARLGDPWAQQRRAAGRCGADAAAGPVRRGAARRSACSTCCATTPPAPTRGSGRPTTGWRRIRSSSGRCTPTRRCRT